MYEPGWPLDIDLPLDERKRLVALARRRVPFWMTFSLGFVAVAAVTIVGVWSITWPRGGAWWLRALFAAVLIVVSFGVQWQVFRLTNSSIAARFERSSMSRGTRSVSGAATTCATRNRG